MAEAAAQRPAAKAWDIAYVRFSAPDLDKMEAFLKDFGLFRARRTPDALYMRGSGSSQGFLHATFRGEPAFLGLGVRMTSEAEVRAVADVDGVPVVASDEPGGGVRATLVDPDGVSVDAVSFDTDPPGWAGESAEWLSQRPDHGYNSARSQPRLGVMGRVGPAGPSCVSRLGHCVMDVSDFRASEAWYKRRFGFITSDEVDVAKGRTLGAFMRCDRGGEYSDHHTLFLVGSGKSRFGHAAFEVANIDDLMMGHFHLASASEKTGAQHKWGIGRHILGNQVFDYWADPWGNTLEHWTDGDQLNAAWGSRRGRSMKELMGVQWGPTVIGSRL